jgi:hypothetical protein
MSERKDGNDPTSKSFLARFPIIMSNPAKTIKWRNIQPKRGLAKEKILIDVPRPL